MEKRKKGTRERERERERERGGWRKAASERTNVAERDSFSATFLPPLFFLFGGAAATMIAHWDIAPAAGAARVRWSRGQQQKDHPLANEEGMMWRARKEKSDNQSHERERERERERKEKVGVNVDSALARV